jgi:hypothetical protein
MDLSPPAFRLYAHKPPSGAEWVHEIMHDGYRLIVRRDGKAVRLFTRRGYDWTDRYPAVAVVAAKLRAKSFTLDGEAAVSGADASPCSRRSTAGAPCQTRSSTRSISWSSTARIFECCRSASARRAGAAAGRRGESAVRTSAQL